MRRRTSSSGSNVGPAVTTHFIRAGYKMRRKEKVESGHRTMPVFSSPSSWQRRAMSKIVGIDLGTTNSLVATIDSGIPLVIADAEGRRLTPSVVHFEGGTGAGVPLVGRPASRVRVLKPRETVYSIKRFIGRRAADISRE